DASCRLDAVVLLGDLGELERVLLLDPGSAEERSVVRPLGQRDLEHGIRLVVGEQCRGDGQPTGDGGGVLEEPAAGDDGDHVGLRNGGKRGSLYGTGEVLHWGRRSVDLTNGTDDRTRVVLSRYHLTPERPC